MTETVPFITLTQISSPNPKLILNTSQVVSIGREHNHTCVDTTNNSFYVKENPDQILELMFGDEV